MIGQIFGLIVGVVIIWQILRSRFPIRVTLSRNGIVKSSNLPEAICKRIDLFARENLDDGELIKLKGHIYNRGRIRWVFPRNASQEFVQRLRNFMVNEVYL